MHDETIPAPLVQRDTPSEPMEAPGSGLMLKLAIGGFIVLCLLTPFLR